MSERRTKSPDFYLNLKEIFSSEQNTNTAELINEKTRTRKCSHFA